MNDRHLDDEFARIVAGWDAEAPDPQAGLPGERPRAAGPSADSTGEPSTAAPAEASVGDTTTADPTLGAAGGPAAGEAPTVAPPPAPSPAVPADGDGRPELGLPIASTTAHVWRGGTPRRDDADEVLAGVDPDDPDDHFRPPSDIDLPSAETDPMFWAIVGGLVGGPLLLLYVLFFDRDGSPWWVVTALAMVVVGFVLLVLRGGTERDPSDDGTRV